MAQLAFLRERFQNLKPLAEGGMGRVLEGDDPVLKRRVAIKTMSDGPQEEATIKRFLEEARATGRLEHPGIPPVFELGKDEEGKPFFALRLVRGQNLAEVIQGLRAGDARLHEKYRFLHRLEVFLRVCEAVAYAHSQGILHRDIKPANILIGDYGQVFLVDWGISYQEESHHQLTQEFSLCGTPAYMAPELFLGTKANVHTDLYSLSATLYEWLTLEEAVTGASLETLIPNILNKAPREADSYFRHDQGRVPREMSNLVHKGLAKKREDRFSGIEAYMDEIRLILEGYSCPVCPHTAIKSGMNWLSRWIDNHPRLGISLFLLMLVLSALGWAALVLLTLHWV